MVSYAVLGATGNVGQSLLKTLLESPSNTIHAYCRSKSKLVKLMPTIADSDQVRVFEGSLDDKELLTNCIDGTRAVFLAVAATGNEPGCHIAQDTAHQVVAALENLATRNVLLPKLVVLSSASTDHRLMSPTPKFLLSILYRAFSNVYDDLREAEQYLRSMDSVVSATFVKPGALSHDGKKGHVLSMETAKSPCSFLDLAAGMVEIAEENRDRYNMGSVAVNSTQEIKFPLEAPLLLLKGLIVHFLPWTYRYLS